MSKNRRILIVDDNPSIHVDFKNILAPSHASTGKLDSMEAALFGEPVASKAQTGFEVDTASQGQEGYAKVIEAMKAGRPYALASSMSACRPAGTASKPWNGSGRSIPTCRL